LSKGDQPDPSAELWYPDPQDLYDDIGNNPHAWLTWVETLTRSAKAIRANTKRGTLPDGTDLMPTELAVYAMLLGYAIECALKGLWVQQGNRIVANGKFIGGSRMKDHQLDRLAKLVGVTLDESELDALERLSAFVLFAGRYPIGLRASQMQPRSVAGQGVTAVGYFSSEDFNTAERVLNRLTTSLRLKRTPV
jgi:hypothetical protein